MIEDRNALAAPGDVNPGARGGSARRLRHPEEDAERAEPRVEDGGRRLVRAQRHGEGAVHLAGIDAVDRLRQLAAMGRRVALPFGDAGEAAIDAGAHGRAPAATASISTPL